MADDAGDPFSVENRKQALAKFHEEHGLTQDLVGAAFEREQSAFKQMEEQQAALKKLIPESAITDMVKGIRPLRIFDPSPIQRLDTEKLAKSVAASRRADRKAQADLIVEPLLGAMDRQHETLGAQHEALSQLNSALEKQTGLMREQARQLEDERTKRAAAEKAEATARAREGFRSTLIVLLTVAIVALTGVLVYLAFNPAASPQATAKPPSAAKPAPTLHRSPTHRSATKG